jgi:four helix bundle protein
MKKSNEIYDRSYQFALDVIRLYRALQVQNEYVLSKHLVRAGTSIGASVAEAAAAQNRKDYMAKMTKASREARETRYWLRLLMDSKICAKIDFSGALAKVEELGKILVATVKSGQQKN